MRWRSGGPYRLKEEAMRHNARLALFFVIIMTCLCLPSWALGYDLTLSDPTGDDYGPGTYVYPLDAAFTPESFDMTRLSVEEIGSDVRFEVEIAGEIEDPWGSGAGFSLQSIDIYIDQDGVAGSGSTGALEGRNVDFSQTSAWEYAVWCGPPFDDFQTHVIGSDGSTHYSGVSVSVDQGSDVITIDVPKSIIGAPNTNWKYVALMLSQAGYETGRVRPVVRDVQQWRLGGGDDGQWDSNVIDVVADAGVNQEVLLANYDPVAGVRAILINRVDAAAPAIAHTPPASWEAHVPFPVQADIQDDVVVSAGLFYRSPGDAYEELSMSKTGASMWETTLPGSEMTVAGLEYYIYATDATNPAMLPDSSSPFTLTVTADVTPPVISALDAHPAVFSPNDDGYKDSTLVAVEVSEPGYAWVAVRDSRTGYTPDHAILQASQARRNPPLLRLTSIWQYGGSMPFSSSTPTRTWCPTAGPPTGHATRAC
jgi:hypothetical protein